MNNMPGRNLKKIPPHVSFRLRYLYQDKGLRGKELLRLYPEFSRTSIYRHVSKSLSSEVFEDGRKQNKGRPKKLTIREERSVLRQITVLRERVGSFSARTLKLEAGIKESQVCDDTIRNLLKANGYEFLQVRRKGDN